MRKLLRTPKLRILGFWILFFVLLILMIASEALGIPKPYFAFAFGILLIGNCVHSIQGRIKRWPYFLSLFALLFMLVILRKIFGSSLSFFELFIQAILTFTGSYFLVSILFVIPVVFRIRDLVKNILDLESLPDFVGVLILGFFLLAVFYPFVVLNIKRLRDIKLSGWFSLITLILGISFLFEIFLCLKGSKRLRRK